MENMKYEHEFQLESLAWLHNMRGRRFLRRLRRKVEKHGPAEALARVTHATMSDEMIEVHAAAIEHVANQLTTRSSECGKSSAWTDQRPGQWRQREFLRHGGV